MRKTCIPAVSACQLAAATRADLPMPASPRTSSAAPRSGVSSSIANSRSRPKDLIPVSAAVRSDEYVAGPHRAPTLGDPVQPVVIAGDILVYWKAANPTSISYPTFYPNPPQHHPTQTDTLRRGSPGNSHP